MTERNKSQPQATGRQAQESRQSGEQPGTPKQDSAGESAPDDKKGIGGSQGQDKGARVQDPSGTADIERGGAGHQDGASQDSMVNDPTGAFKERP